MTIAYTCETTLSFGPLGLFMVPYRHLFDGLTTFEPDNVDVTLMKRASTTFDMIASSWVALSEGGTLTEQMYDALKVPFRATAHQRATAQPYPYYSTSVQGILAFIFLTFTWHHSAPALKFDGNGDLSVDVALDLNVSSYIPESLKSLEVHVPQLSYDITMTSKVTDHYTLYPSTHMILSSVLSIHAHTLTNTTSPAAMTS